MFQQILSAVFSGDIKNIPVKNKVQLLFKSFHSITILHQNVKIILKLLIASALFERFRCIGHLKITFRLFFSVNLKNVYSRESGDEVGSVYSNHSMHTFFALVK